MKVEIVGQGQDSYDRSALVLRRAVDVAVGPQSSELVNARPFVKRQSRSVQHRRITSPHYQLEGKYSLESTDLRESEIRAPPQPLPYLMPIPQHAFL